MKKFINILEIFSIIILIGFIIKINFFTKDNINTIDSSKFNKTIDSLQNKIDSLEKVVNSNLTHRRDTLIIDVRPQTIKIYQPNGNSINNNSSIASTPR